MEIGELLFISFCSLAAINALFFAGYIWFRRDRNIYPSILLSLFLLITAYRIVQMLLHDLQDDFNLGINVRTFFFFIPTFPLIGPFLFLYIKSISSKDFKFTIKHLLHLLPFISFLITDLLNRGNFPLSYDNRTHYMTYCVEITVILVQFLIYLIVSFSFVRKLIKQNIPEKSSKDNIDPFYIKNIVLIISFFWIIYTLYCIQTYFRFYFPTRVIEAVYYSFLSYLILYYELRGQRITSANNYAIRYKSSALSAEDSLKYKAIILEYISKNESYKDHIITLGKFSKSLSLTPHVVSQVINEQLSNNFNDFINSYRVEEAKKMLMDPERKNFTIASIAYDSGFNTLSAFNVAFKKFTGVTPSQFRLKDK
jgi:AraC-like DNA-binding protein